ncbi:hypothetical protein MY006_46660 [Escherichia coli]|nr:hypothetical protein MY006_46660 [Escherichia coli]
MGVFLKDLLLYIFNKLLIIYIYTEAGITCRLRRPEALHFEPVKLIKNLCVK